MPDTPYLCTGEEKPGRVELFSAGVKFNIIMSSRCFAEYLCAVNEGWTWEWENGVDPDDPTTWPGYEPPEEPENP